MCVAARIGLKLSCCPTEFLQPARSSVPLPHSSRNACTPGKLWEAQASSDTTYDRNACTQARELMACYSYVSFICKRPVDASNFTKLYNWPSYARPASDQLDAPQPAEELMPDTGSAEVEPPHVGHAESFFFGGKDLSRIFASNCPDLAAESYRQDAEANGYPVGGEEGADEIGE